MEISDRRVNDVRATIEDRVLKLPLKAQQICASRYSANSIHAYPAFSLFFSLFLFPPIERKETPDNFSNVLTGGSSKILEKEKRTYGFCSVNKIIYS